MARPSSTASDARTRSPEAAGGAGIVFTPADAPTAVKSAIRVCAAWETTHDRPVYTLGDRCPDCGARAVNSAPAPFDPDDRYGGYRRALKRGERG